MNATSCKDLAPVSVVIPCYRCADTIERAVESVYRQSLRPFELILVEDKGGDETLEILYQIQDRYPENWIVVVEREINGGAGSARNSGWEKASQPYVAFLDADDCWHLNKIELQLNWMCLHPNVLMSGHSINVIDECDYDKAVGRTCVSFDPKPVSILNLLMSNRFPTPSVIVKKDAKFRFLDGKRFSEDYLLWLFLCANGECVVSSSALTFCFKNVYGEGGLSANLWKMTRGELDTYRYFVKKQNINWFIFYLLSAFSLVKHLRRVFLLKIRAR